MAVFTYQCLPYLAKMSTIFILLYISLDWLYLSNLAKIHIFASLPLDTICITKIQYLNFQKWKPKPTMKCNRKYYKNTEQVLAIANFGSIIRLSDMECCAFIRHLVIGFAKTDNTLKLPKMECFPILSFHIWQLLDFPIPGPETYFGKIVRVFYGNRAFLLLHVC